MLAVVFLDHPIEGCGVLLAIGLVVVGAATLDAGYAVVGLILGAAAATAAMRGGVLSRLRREGVIAAPWPALGGVLVVWLIIALLLVGPLR